MGGKEQGMGFFNVLSTLFEQRVSIKCPNCLVPYYPLDPTERGVEVIVSGKKQTLEICATCLGDAVSLDKEALRTRWISRGYTEAEVDLALLYINFLIEKV